MEPNIDLEHKGDGVGQQHVHWKRKWRRILKARNHTNFPGIGKRRTSYLTCPQPMSVPLGFEQVRKIEERIWQEELQRGKHLPGYGGYVSQNENSVANDISLPRRTQKEKMLLVDLDEYSREISGGTYAGYGGFKPQDVKQDYMMNLDHGRHSEWRTTNGHTNMMCQRERVKMKYRPPILAKPVPGSLPVTKKGLKGFFEDASSDPKGGTSEQGKAQAEKYFSVVRPYEGTLLAMNSSRSIKSRSMQ